MSRIQLFLFGKFDLIIDGQPIADFPKGNVQALLIYLALNPGDHRREALAELLWPGPIPSLGNLRSTLSRLRSTLEKAAPGITDTLIISTRHTLGLNLKQVIVDAVQFEALLKQCEAHPHRHLHDCNACLNRLEQAIALYRGELLVGTMLRDQIDEFEGKLLRQRQFLKDKALSVLSKLATAYELRGEFRQAHDYASRSVDLAPFQGEATHRQLMRILVHLGQRNLALKHYESYQSDLNGEMDAKPEARTTTLYKQIETGEFDQTPATYAEHALLEQVVVTTNIPLVPQIPENRTINTATVEEPIIDWGDRPNIESFYGREEEQALLIEWLVHNPHRLVAILGMGGAGKSTLTAHVVTQVACHFEFVLWYSLSNAPSLDRIVERWLRILSHQQLAHLPDPLSERLYLLVDYLDQHRCMLILDNMESILNADDHAGHALKGYEGFIQCLQLLCSNSHQSCLVLTSRERPHGLSRLQRMKKDVKILHLSGLDEEAAQAILATHGLQASASDTANLNALYSGNPLALHIAADTIMGFHDGNVGVFLNSGLALFDGIRVILEQQFSRLTEVERDVLIWLSIHRETTSFHVLNKNLDGKSRPNTIQEALLTLQRRSLLIKRDSIPDPGSSVVKSGFMVQNVVMEYVTEELLKSSFLEIQTGELFYLARYPLLQAQAKEYIRASQLQLLIQPIAEQLQSNFESVAIKQKLQELLTAIRCNPSWARSYAGGNILNVLLHLRIDTRGVDFSDMAIRQAFLRSKYLPSVNLTNADLSDAVFTDTFSMIRATAFSPDGRYLAAGTSHGDIRLWAADTRQPVGLLQGHSRLVQCIAFSPDGQYLVSGGEDGSVRYWNVASIVDNAQSGHSSMHLDSRSDAPPCMILHKDEQIVRAIAFSPDGQFIASGGDDQLIRLWHTETCRAAATFHGHRTLVTGLDFSPNQQILASCSGDHTIRLWNLAEVQHKDETQEFYEGYVLCNLSHDRANVFYQVAFSPDGQRVAGCTFTGIVALWSVADLSIELSMASEPLPQIDSEADLTEVEKIGPRICTLQNQTGSINAIAFHADGRILAGGGDERVIRLWDIEREQVMNTLQGHADPIMSLSFSPDGSQLASSSGDQTLRLWDVETGYPTQIMTGYAKPVNTLTFSLDGRVLVSGGNDQAIHVWDVATSGEEVVLNDIATHSHMLSGHTNLLWSVAIRQDGNVVASSSEDMTIRLWDMRSRQPMHILQQQKHIITTVAFSPDGKTLASSSFDHSVCLWDVRTGQYLAQLVDTDAESTDHGAWSSTYSPDGLILAVGYHGGRIVMWDTQTGEKSLTLEGHTSWVRSLAFSQDGALLASASNDRTVCLWDARSGKRIKVLDGHDDWVMSVAFSPDDTILASASHDRTIRLWPVASIEEPHILKGHKNGVMSIAFHPSSNQLASGSHDETIKFWDLETRRCVQTLRAPGPYEGLNITGSRGVSPAQKAAILTLGGVDGTE
ncbi:MAG: BTAD domain-containing putative transcriptional regulator [Chloroflexota bacterium]